MTNSYNTGSGAQGTAAKNNFNVMVFENPEFGRVRMIQDKDGEPLFCGKDVCEVLGYVRADIAVRQHVNPSDVTKRYVARPAKNRYGESTKMQNVQMLFVNESGFYSLVLSSKLETAQQFKHWVTSEVLPAIRKNGGYFHITPNETAEEIKARFERVMKEALAERDSTISLNKKLIAEQTTRIRELDELVGTQVVTIQKKSEEILCLESDIDRLLPRAFYADNVLDSISCYTTTQIAKELGITAQELNRSLCASHVQYYQSGQYLLYADYAHMGLAKSRTRYKMVADETPSDNGEKTGRIFTHTYLVWTERGRKFIHDLAKRQLHLTSINSIIINGK